MTMKAMWLMLGSVLVALVYGCTPTTEGVAVPTTGLPVKAIVSDVSFVTPDGKETTLNHVRLPITVVAFVANEGTACDRLSPQLVDLSKHFVHLPISIVQVSEPTSQCPHGPGCTQVNGAGRRDVIAICDPQQVAWRAYAAPKAGTVFLINHEGVVLLVASLDDMSGVADRAVDEGRQYADLHHGGWTGQY